MGAAGGMSGGGRIRPASIPERPTPTTPLLPRGFERNPHSYYSVNFPIYGVCQQKAHIAMNDNATFDALMRSYGFRDVVVCLRGAAFRFEAYHDGGWLEGYRTTSVVYWGA